MTFLAVSIFSAAFVIAGYAIGATLLPNLGRIADALAGRSQSQFAPLDTLVRAERRIAVRRWATNSRATTPMRAAA